MPLTTTDRQFLTRIDHLKVYLLVMAGVVFLFILLIPSGELHAATSVLGLALCGIFWLTHRLLGFISLLDLELTRLSRAVERSMTEEQRREFTSGG